VIPAAAEIVAHDLTRPARHHVLKTDKAFASAALKAAINTDPRNFSPDKE
jgi:hypothetical protein